MIDIKTWDALRYTLNNLSDIDQTSIYCHYTTPAAVVSIFKKYIDGKQHGPITECNMRASHIRFLNDSQEYLDGLNWIKKKLRGNRPPLDNLAEDIYSISFCGHEDLLSQWKWYGKNSGVAISFDMKNIKYKYYDVEEPLPEFDCLTKPLSVKYDEQKKAEYYNRVKKLCREKKLNEGEYSFFANLLLPFCKDETFCEEKESRLVFYDVDGRLQGIKPISIHYVPSENKLKPTMNVEFKALDEGKSIVKQFTIGPGQDQELVYNAIIHVLGGEIWSPKDTKDANGYVYQEINGITVRKSLIPFRG